MLKVTAKQIKKKVKEEVLDEIDALVAEGDKGPKGSPDVPKKGKKPGAEPKKRAIPKKKNADTSSDGLKQTKLNFKSKGCKKKSTSSDEDELSGSDIEMQVSVAPRADRPGRRATAKKINYSGLLDSDEDVQSSEGEMVFKDNKAVLEESTVMAKISDSENDVNGNGDSEEDTPIKKAPGKRPRKKNISDSDSDNNKKGKRKKKVSSDSDDFDF
ncbi:DNA topoisomerase 2-like isoform X2 [Teleopsis dalmanni]|uniref:DNA topoisomerase 2-like isoform X1 n=1 Tax=Teleopsis dalmanni TaxID=139649 RepID=UPI0018CEECE2|nr:DNA topoisomerase 2-like isoform X1 [Teleopsis dalmanni]XP_037927438.1 DNA topoisomerase 2-like isoform X2 [Teleopsis dalmanni]